MGAEKKSLNAPNRSLQHLASSWPTLLWCFDTEPSCSLHLQLLSVSTEGVWTDLATDSFSKSDVQETKHFGSRSHDHQKNCGFSCLLPTKWNSISTRARCCVVAKIPAIIFLVKQHKSDATCEIQFLIVAYNMQLTRKKLGSWMLHMLLIKDLVEEQRLAGRFSIHLRPELASCDYCILRLPNNDINGNSLNNDIELTVNSFR